MGVHGKLHIYGAVWLVFPFVVVFFLAYVEGQWLECILSCVVCFMAVISACFCSRSAASL